MAENRISIIVPVFNASATLNRALASVRSQTHPDTELVVVDGKSTDNSLDIAKEFSPEILISETDSGVYSAMNKGVEKSTGDWLFFLGADDEMAAPDVFEKLLNASPGVHLICGKVKNINRPDRRIPEVYDNRFTSNLRWKNTLHHQGVLYHKSCFTDFKFDESLKILGDYDLNLHLFQAGAKAFHTDVLISFSDASGLSKNFNKNLYKEELKVKKKYFNPAQILVQRIWVWMKFGYKNI